VLKENNNTGNKISSYIFMFGKEYNIMSNQNKNKIININIDTHILYSKY